MNIDDITGKFSHPTVKRCRELMDKIKSGKSLTPEEFKELDELGSIAGKHFKGNQKACTVVQIPTKSEQKVLDIFSGTICATEEETDWLKHP